MRKWELVCSRDGIGIDYTETIEQNEEPGFWMCYEIAAKHGCEFFTCELVN